MFDQQPFILASAALQLHQHEASVQLVAMQTKLQLAAFELFCRAERYCGFVCALIPDDDFTGAVVSFGYRSFKLAVFKWMVFHLNSQTFVSGIERRSFGYGPGFQHPPDFEAQIIVKPPRSMFLNDEDVFVFACFFPSRLRRIPKSALSTVFRNLV